MMHYRRCSHAKCPVCAPVRELIRKVNGGGGWGGVLNQGYGIGMFWDSTSQGGKLKPSSLLLSTSEARGISIADRDGDARNMSPSPDQDSHRLRANPPKTEHCNRALSMEISNSISPSMARLGSGSYVCGDKLGCGPQEAVFYQSVRSEDLLRTRLSKTFGGSAQEKLEERLKTLSKEKAESEVRNLIMFVHTKYFG